MAIKLLIVFVVLLFALLTKCHLYFLYLFTEWKVRLEKKFPYPLQIVAHRGGSVIGPENTIYTFEKALKSGGANMLEMDVWMSLDKKIVVSHDDNLERTCGQKHRGVKISKLIVGDSPSRTLPQCARSIHLHFKNGDTSNYVASSGVPVNDCTRVCLLSEVFERFPQVPMHIDIKMLSAEAVWMVLDMIRKFNREKITVVGSSVSKNKEHINAYFRKHTTIRSKFHIFASPKDFMIVHILYYLGVLPFYKFDFDVFSIPVYTTSMYEHAKLEYNHLLALFASLFFTTPDLWQYLQCRGIAVLGWVVNGEANFAETVAWPLNGIMTDDPKSLLSFTRSLRC